MTDMLKKSEKINTSDVYVNSDNLTEQWKKGELPEGWYYVKDEDGQIIIAEYYAYCIDKETNEAEYDWSCCSEPEQVLAEVPSYDLWKAVHEQWKVLLEENTKLKELLKECQDEIEYLRKHYKGNIDHLKNNTRLDKEIAQVLADNQIQANTVACNKIQESK